LGFSVRRIVGETLVLRQAQDEGSKRNARAVILIPRLSKGEDPAGVGS
jgi:hypothetical protein